MKISLLAFSIAALACHTNLAANDLDSFTETRIEESTMCITLFSPASCSGNYGGEAYEALGTNECLAKQHLLYKINNTYAWFIEVTLQDIQQLACSTAIPQE